MKYSIYYYYAPVELYQCPHHYLLLFSKFPIIVFNIYFFNIYTSSTFPLPYLFISPLLLQPFSLPYFFISPLPSKLISFFLFPFIFLYFCFFLFTPSYYKFFAISSILQLIRFDTFNQTQ